ncbi:MAG TPA: Ig-like domain-containing protein [Kofleriaceae bacterium]|jgi:hypothetical protein
MNRFAFCALALFFACSPVKGTPLIDAPPSVSSIQIAPGSASLRVGLDVPMPLTVEASLPDGTMRDVTPYVTWSSSADSVATVPLGNVTAVAAGSATITATLDGLMATAAISVRDPILAVASQESGSNLAGIDFFDAFATGDTAPIRSIRGSNTQLEDAFHLFADTKDNELYVADLGAGLLVFPLDGNGDIAPLRHIPAGSAATLEGIIDVAVDNDEIYLAGETGSSAGEIAVFSRLSDGSAAAPTRMIAGSDSSITGLSQVITALAIHDGMIYAASSTLSGETPGTITVYPETSSGEVAPTVIFAGASSEILQPIGMDFRGNELIDSDAEGDAIDVYSLAGGSNITPVRTINGIESQVALPTDLVLIGQTLVCAQDQGNMVTTYPIEALQDQAPSSTLGGSATLITLPIGLTAF